ncbi:hypothetical protein PO124_13710 [Bacillus licheniformis]|nr:hypothetical protein [Bacillus licheniformis]
MPKPDKATQEAIDARVKSSQELERTQTELKIAEAEAKRKDRSPRYCRVQRNY